MRRIIVILLFCLTASFVYAQKKRQQSVDDSRKQTLRYEDYNYLPQIRSVEFYNRSKEQSLPLLNLSKNNEELFLAFDDLRAGSRYYFYTLEHCDAQWNSSRLSPMDYLETFTEDRITESRSSVNTFQKYTHYELIFPNNTIKPKIAGNYLLKVYENGEQDRLILTRRLYIVNPVVTVFAEIGQSPNISLLNKQQKINLTINHQQLDIQNPYQDVKVLVMQNARPDNLQLASQPTFIRQRQLIYNDLKNFIFMGGNEFRQFDMRSFRLKSEKVYRIVKDSIYHVDLYNDTDISNTSYQSYFDENGDFFVRNNDNLDNRTETDYAQVNFQLAASPPSGNGNAYIVGKFNSYQISDENRLTYDTSKQQFTGSLLLKQGIYDYHYIWADSNGKLIDDTIFDGSHFETQNSYQLFFYYRKPGARWEELLGFQELNPGGR